MDDIKPPVPAGSAPSNLPQSSPTPPPPSSEPNRPAFTAPSAPTLTPRIIPPNVPPRPVTPPAVHPAIPSATPKPPSVPAPVRPGIPPAATTPQAKIPAPGSSSLPLKSSIRTMQDDLAALKKGQLPAGIELQKPKESLTPSMPPAIPVAPRPSTTLPHTGISNVPPIRSPLPSNPHSSPLPPPPSPNFRPAPVTRTVPPAPSPVTVPEQVPKIPGGIVVPQSSGFFRNNIKLLAVAALVIVLGGAGAAAYFLYFQGTVEPTPTPVASATPTVTPLSQLEKVAGTSLNTIKLPASGYPYDAFKAFISNEKIDPGEMTFYKVGSEQGKNYYFDEFVTRLGITLPPNVDTSFVKNADWVFGLYGQIVNAVDTVDKKAIAVVEVTDPIQTRAMMTNWESTLSEDFKQLFNYNLGSTPPEFVSDTYLGESYRYIKVTDKNSGLAYAIVGKLLVFASSKDSFHALVGLILSK